MADKQGDNGVEVHNVGFTVHALHILEQVGQEADRYGIALGVGLIYEIIQRIAIRASELHDAELDRLINKLHLYEDMEFYEELEDKKKEPAKADDASASDTPKTRDKS